ncbi:hypothetical protein ES703_56115 [subsurface metagenome]
MICPKCQFQNRPDSTFCARCGKRLHFFCPACGATIAEEISYCIKCGHGLHVYPPSLMHKGEQEKEERHKEYYMPRVRSARIASVLDNLLGLKEENRISDMRRDHLEHSLCHLFEDPWLSLHADSDVSGFLHDYWQAIKELWPEAFDDSNEYCVRDMLGFSILNKVFPDVIHLCRKAGDFSKETMRQMLTHTGIGSDFWRERNLMRGQFDPSTRSFISDPESCISVATAYVREKLGVIGDGKTSTHGGSKS